MAKVSVIVPVYNVENYLGKCLDSIINQTFSDIEIICVNDGSTDNSLNILNEYSQKDDRIKIISQENKGLSAARNAGYNASSSDYIYYIDSDDWIENNTIESVYKKATENDSDVVIFGTNNIYSDNNVLKNNRRIVNLIKKYNRYNFHYADCPDLIYLPCTAWLKLYKKSFLDKNKLFFEEEIKFSEDTVFWVSLVLKDAKITLMEDCFHYYRFMRPNSMNLYNNILQKFYNTLNFYTNSDFFKNLNIEDKKRSLDYFLVVAIRIYSDARNLKELFLYECGIKQYFNLLKQNHIKLNFNYIGFKLLKFRLFYTFGKKLYLFFNTIKK